jgi:hypothetical protein
MYYEEIMFCLLLRRRGWVHVDRNDVIRFYSKFIKQRQHFRFLLPWPDLFPAKMKILRSFWFVPKGFIEQADEALAVSVIVE